MATDPAYPISPAELMKLAIFGATTREFVPNVVVGPANKAQLRQGVTQLATSGTTADELYIAIIKPRIQIRCIRGELADSERMARHIVQVLHGTGRRIVQQSTGEKYLIHYINISGGPSDHFDTAETWEGLLFADTMMGLRPIPA